jgi:hypothetical protein
MSSHRPQPRPTVPGFVDGHERENSGATAMLAPCETRDAGNAPYMESGTVDPTPVLKARLSYGLSGLVPRTHARSLAQLRAAHPGLGPDELAKQLVSEAAKAGAAVGAVAACCAIAPVPAAAPLATTGESAVVSALRTRLTAELHTVYGLLEPSPVNQGATGHLLQWATRDTGGVTSLAALPALALAATKAVPRTLRRHKPKLRTLVAGGAVVAGLRCGRATRRYGEALRLDLRADPTAWSDWPADEPGRPGASA